MAAFCLSSVKWLVTRARTPPGFRASTRLGEEEIMQRQLLAAVVELHVGERRVADHGIDAAASAAVAESLDADVGSGCRARAMRPRDAVQLDADEPHARRRPGP